MQIFKASLSQGYAPQEGEAILEIRKRPYRAMDKLMKRQQICNMCVEGRTDFPYLQRIILPASLSLEFKVLRATEWQGSSPT